MSVPDLILRLLHPHQERALERLRTSLAAGRRRPMLQAPTGFGKTLTAAHVIRRALDQGEARRLHRAGAQLIDQTVAAFEAEGIDCVGVMQGIHGALTDPAGAGLLVQTLARRKRPDVDLVIVDEAHQLPRKSSWWMADRPNVPLHRPERDAVDARAGQILRRPDRRGDDGRFDPRRLSRRLHRLRAERTGPVAGVRTVAGDFHEDELAEAMDRPWLIGDIVDTWLKRGEDRPTLCFCVNRAHAQHIAERFIEAGVPCEYMDGETPRQEREATFDRFRSARPASSAMSAS